MLLKSNLNNFLDAKINFVSVSTFQTNIVYIVCINWSTDKNVLSLKYLFVIKLIKHKFLSQMAQYLEIYL